MATKNIKREALKILKEFEIAGKLSTSAEVGMCKEHALGARGRLLQVVFMSTPYVIVVSDAAEDDTTFLLETIQSVLPQARGTFIRNPHEDSFETFGVRHKFRDTYVMELTPSTIRLDKEVARRYPEYSRATIQKYIKAGYVRVTGVHTPTPKTEVTEYTEIALVPPQRVDTSARELPIIYLDDNVIVVNKPAGVLTHSKGALNDEFTVADFFRRYTTHALTTTRPGVVHRLDRDTSGVIIGARNDETAAMLKKQFSDRTVKKHYTAVVDGAPKLDEAIIDLPIGRNPSAPSTFRVDPKGKPALTRYKVLSSNGRQSLVELKPKTGRTHQLRVHMQYIHAPIAGDRVYGSATSATRLCLHAHSLELTIPTAERKVFTAPVPPEFKDMVAS